MKKEKRFSVGVELREDAGEETGPQIVGYAAMFDRLSNDLGGFREKIKKGAFARTLKEGADVRALVDHDSGKILGRNTAGTLKIKEDDQGLHIEIIPPDTQAARDILISIDRQDVTGMSFGFLTRTDEWNMEDGVYVRTLVDVDLFDVSVVTYRPIPMHPLGYGLWRCIKRVKNHLTSRLVC